MGVCFKLFKGLMFFLINLVHGGADVLLIRGNRGWTFFIAENQGKHRLIYWLPLKAPVQSINIHIYIW